MPHPMSFRPCSPGSAIIPETEFQVSNEDSTSNYHPAIFPTSESTLGLDEDGVGRQKFVAEMSTLNRIGATPLRLTSVSERLQLLENNGRVQHGRGNDNVQSMDISPETNRHVEHEARDLGENNDTPTIGGAVELMKELRGCIRELRVMYQVMQESNEIRKNEEAIRLTAYHDILRSIGRDY